MNANPLQCSITKAEAAEFISTHRIGNCREGKGDSAEDTVICRRSGFWGCAEDAPHCHPILDGEQTWGTEETVALCRFFDTGFIF